LLLAEPAPAVAPEPLPASPWSVAMLRVLAVGVVIAAVLLGLAWLGCSGQTVWHVQVRWLGLGVLACALNAVACLIWLAAGLREVRKARAWTIEALRGRGLLPVAAFAAPAVPTGELVTSARMRRYHRPDCPLMRGKIAQVVPATAAANLPGCGICGS
jgi:hypothetical protein